MFSPPFLEHFLFRHWKATWSNGSQSILASKVQQHCSRTSKFLVSADLSWCNSLVFSQKLNTTSYDRILYIFHVVFIDPLMESISLSLTFLYGVGVWTFNFRGGNRWFIHWAMPEFSSLSLSIQPSMIIERNKNGYFNPYWLDLVAPRTLLKYIFWTVLNPILFFGKYISYLYISYCYY